MIDFGVFTLPILGVLSLLGYGILSGPEVVIEPIVVPHALEDQGYTSEVVTRRLADEVRRINDVADSSLRPVNVDLTQLDRSYNALTDYFEVTQVMDAIRQSIGLVPFYFAGDIVVSGNDIEFRLRAYPSKGEVLKFVHRAPIDNVESVIVRASADMMKVIDPYVAALYSRAVEEKAPSKDFRQTMEGIRYAFTMMDSNEQHFVHLLWSRTLFLAGRYDEALTVADATIALKPDFANGYYAKARTLVALGRTEESLAQFQRAINLNHFSGEMYVDYAKALEAMGRTDDALVTLRKAAVLVPRSPQVHHAAGLLLTKLGRKDEALLAFREAIAHTTDELHFFDDYRTALLAGGAPR